eukprot:759809-Hanusia_phi.AAC.5
MIESICCCYAAVGRLNQHPAAALYQLDSAGNELRERTEMPDRAWHGLYDREKVTLNAALVQSILTARCNLEELLHPANLLHLKIFSNQDAMLSVRTYSAFQTIEISPANIQFRCYMRIAGRGSSFPGKRKRSTNTGFNQESLLTTNIQPRLQTSISHPYCASPFNLGSTTTRGDNSHHSPR